MIAANKLIGPSPTGVASCRVVVEGIDYPRIHVFIVKDE